MTFSFNKLFLSGLALFNSSENIPSLAPTLNNFTITPSYVLPEQYYAATIKPNLPAIPELTSWDNDFEGFREKIKTVLGDFNFLLFKNAFTGVNEDFKENVWLSLWVSVDKMLLTDTTSSDFMLKRELRHQWNQLIRFKLKEIDVNSSEDSLSEKLKQSIAAFQDEPLSNKINLNVLFPMIGFLGIAIFATIDNHNRTKLSNAIRTGDLETVKKLLPNKAFNINSNRFTDSSYRGPIDIAVQYSQKGVAKLLFKKSLDKNICNCTYFPDLIKMALENRSPQMLDLLAKFISEEYIESFQDIYLPPLSTTRDLLAAFTSKEHAAESTLSRGDCLFGKKELKFHYFKKDSLIKALVKALEKHGSPLLGTPGILGLMVDYLRPETQNTYQEVQDVLTSRPNPVLLRSQPATTPITDIEPVERQAVMVYTPVHSPQ
jgi:hypothetical protein